MAVVVDAPPTPEELRVRMARLMVRQYVVALRAGLHPSHLGGMLRERISMPAETARRIAAAMDELERT